MTDDIGPYGPAGLEPRADAHVMREGRALLEQCRRASRSDLDRASWYTDAVAAAAEAIEAGTRAAFRDAGGRTRDPRFGRLVDDCLAGRHDAPRIALRHLHAWLWAYGRAPGAGRFGCRVCGRLSLARLGLDAFCWTCGWRSWPFDASDERRRNGMTLREARRRFTEAGVVAEDRRALVRAPFLCELLEDPHARKWLAIDLGELADLRDRLSRAHRALERRGEARTHDPASSLLLCVRNLRAHEVWAGVGKFELFRQLYQRDDSSMAIGQLVVRAGEYLRALGHRLSHLPTYACEACDAPTLHTPGYPCPHCGWYPSATVELKTARRNVARYDRAHRHRARHLRPLYSFERNETRGPIELDRTPPASLDTLRTDAPDPVWLIERARRDRPTGHGIHLSAKRYKAAQDALACTFGGRVIDVQHDPEERVVVIVFGMIGLYWDEQIGPAPRLAEVSAHKFDRAWSRSERWVSPVLRGSVTIRDVRELRHSGATSPESTAWVRKQRSGYLIDIHHDIQVETRSVALTVDVEPIVLGNVIIDTTHTMEGTWRSSSYRWEL